ncbi:hypothetical protein K443DRAFT_686166 [Laccaria amethystina LaAM-08-1]|uniref:Unplaced genomic scaffold K443scaffold_491, whole genome shotgun sequence n=1 Tax=Laccaria amethystina LaAM-08-1 TaxID=1095629 RepID=A0A0C9WMQ0_9AGAR|nr:hypothetical protein K443DRAFT_686166 [Laccaria amethystina LaAM-08-1]
MAARLTAYAIVMPTQTLSNHQRALQDSKTLTTTKGIRTMKRHLEETLRRHSKIRYDCNEGGSLARLADPSFIRFCVPAPPAGVHMLLKQNPLHRLPRLGHTLDTSLLFPDGYEPLLGCTVHWTSRSASTQG